MPNSLPLLNAPTFKLIDEAVSNGAYQILDVGAGEGKYGIYLKKSGGCFVTGIEVFEEYVERFSLHDIYDRVLIGNIVQMVDGLDPYDIIIMGDILEHLSVQDAQMVITKLTKLTPLLIVVVPFQSHQGTTWSNPYEKHLQTDLTPEIMKGRFPELSLVETASREDGYTKGLYVFREIST
jgi:cyclopropane fatty-acyl-phospholipid synthase-like methyltransferase